MLFIYDYCNKQRRVDAVQSNAINLINNIDTIDIQIQLVYIVLINLLEKKQIILMSWCMITIW